jgi:Domain of unknown function (DUF4838)
MNVRINSTVYVLVFMSSLITNFVFAQEHDLKFNEWMKNWQLLGPIELEEGVNEVNHLDGFENEILSSHGSESNFQFKSGQTEKFNDINLTWKEYTSTDSIINLDKLISKRSYIAAYAYTEIYSEEEKTVIFTLGTNDGGRLWINGEVVWDYSSGRGLKPDEDLIPILLRKGTNQILLKIEERGNAWGFCTRVLPFNIDTFTNSGKLFEVVTLPNGDSELRFSLNESVIDNLFDSMNLEVYSNELVAKQIWNGDWSKKNSMKLPIKNGVMKSYILNINSERKNGEKWTKEIHFNSGKRTNYTLFENKETEYKIIVGEDASESERWAAEELRKVLFEISGANFEIINDRNKSTDKEIIVGYNKHTKRLFGEKINIRPKYDESFIYKNVESNIVLVGGKQRGTMYAVFSFLENEFGVRWYTPNVTEIPNREKYVFNYITHSEKPSIQVRNDFYYEAFNPTWAAHNKINGAMGFRKQHGDIEGYWSVHTFYRFMPPSEFYNEHPEYYSLIDGKRIYDHAQLCLTNSNVLNIITERLKQTMRDNPSNLIYSVSQNDWSNPCQCNNCQAIVDEEGGQSGIMVWFVNEVAERIKDEFPNKYVGTLAYQYTRKPPKNIKPNENVVIRLCSIECCFAHDFKSCPENLEFLSDLEGWSAISPHLYIWDYVVNFSHYIMPYPNFNVLQSNIKTFRDNKSIGIMEQAAYQSRGGEFAELRAYLISKLLWNAESDVDEVIDDFMNGYYGRSGQYIKEYFNLLHKQVKDDTHIHLGLTPKDKIFSEEFTKEADIIFDKAETLAETDEIKERVEMARLPLMYLKCRRNPINSKYDGTYERFNIIVEREGITHFAELGIPHFNDFHEYVNSSK